jgi:hypothetical protein
VAAFVSGDCLGAGAITGATGAGAGGVFRGAAADNVGTLLVGFWNCAIDPAKAGVVILFVRGDCLGAGGVTGGARAGALTGGAAVMDGTLLTGF